jgi:Transposase domain (DUF772)
MIEMRRAQPSFGDGLIAEEVDDLRERWMQHADAVLGDDELVAMVHKALAQRRPNSRRRGRPAWPAETVLRLLILKHIRNWSYDVLEREVRANLVYRDFTGVGAAKMPDAKTMVRWGIAVGAPMWSSRSTAASSSSRRKTAWCRGGVCASTPQWSRPTSTIRPIRACWETGSGC